MNQFTKFQVSKLNVTSIVHISEVRTTAMLVLLMSEGLNNIGMQWLQWHGIHTEI
jgi:hypothetical protein